MTQRILLVDDDTNILQAYKRQFRRQFEIATAQSGKEGLETIQSSGPFAVIVSDMRMPNMDGAQFLNKVRLSSPESVRMMLTGNADQKTAMQAVNDGQIFRFLTKPSSPEDFTKALEAGLEQYRLVTSERELLSKTLSGCVSILTEALSLVNQTAFGRSLKVKRLVRHMCHHLQVENEWEIEIAAMLSQVGCIAIPEATLVKMSVGGTLSAEELRSYQEHPRIGHDLIVKIPRLEGVANIIACQQKCFDGSGIPTNELQGDQIPLGARILKLVIDVVQLLATGASTERAFYIIRNREGMYDPALVEVLANGLETEYVIKSVEVKDVGENMIVDEHVVTKAGDVLLACGQEVTLAFCERLKTFANSISGVREPIRVRCPTIKFDTNQAKLIE